MAVSDLTNTTWVFNSTIDVITGPRYMNINFASNNTNYIQSDCYYDDYEYYGPEGYYLLYFDAVGTPIVVYDSNNSTWSNQAYRTITITGGIDATSAGSGFASLVSWLEANATQLTISDLTNTTWVFNNVIDYYGGTYNINFTSNNTNFVSLEFYSGGIGNFLRYNLTNTEESAYIWTVNEPEYEEVNEWLDTAYKTITITGGSSVTNSFLIAWLTTNATYQPPVPDVTFDLSTLSLRAGTYTVTVKAEADGWRDSAASTGVSWTWTPVPIMLDQFTPATDKLTSLTFE